MTITQEILLLALCFVVVVAGGSVILQPATVVSIDCPTEPYASLAGAFGLLHTGGSPTSRQPNFALTLDGSPSLYTSDVWGIAQNPVSLRNGRAARLAATNARLRGAARYGESLFLVFSRNEALSPASILQIDRAFGTSQAFQYHPLGDVLVVDVVASPKAIYLLLQSRPDLNSDVVRFDLARGISHGVQLPISGGRLALSADQNYLLVAGPAKDSTLCGGAHDRCTLAFSLDSEYLRRQFATTNLGDCTVTALAVTVGGNLYMASTSGQFCSTQSSYGVLRNATWSFSSASIGMNAEVRWAVQDSYGGFLEGISGQVYSSSFKTWFTLRTDESVSYHNQPILVHDAMLGPCIVFPAVACKNGNLPLYVFQVDQFVSK